MKGYPFRLVNHDSDEPVAKKVLRARPFIALDASFEADAARFVPGSKLETAINTAIAVGEPLLITGEPGTGKTQTAYYIGYKLNLKVHHFQVKSDSSARDLLYHFDSVEYFRDAQVRLGQNGDPQEKEKLDKANYVRPRALWDALEGDEPAVLLIDEIDKAPRDFPNDLLLELDKMEFTVIETNTRVALERDQQWKRPIVVITSNSERRLPEPFLRRCVYHHIVFDDDLVWRAVESRRDEYRRLSDDFLKLALQRFLALRARPLRKRPATGEFLVWLRVLALTMGTYPEQLEQDLSKLPYLSTLLKHHKDPEAL